MAANKQHEPLTARGRFWQRHLQRWRQSGLTQVQYCRQQRLSAAAFGWWKGRLSAERAPGIKPKRVSDEIAGPSGPFVEVAFSGSGPTGGSQEFPYEITLAPPRCLRLGRHYELERVRQPPRGPDEDSVLGPQWVHRVLQATGRRRVSCAGGSFGRRRDRRAPIDVDPGRD
jgi:hypothetical protein